MLASTMTRSFSVSAQTAPPTVHPPHGVLQPAQDVVRPTLVRRGLLCCAISFKPSSLMPNDAHRAQDLPTHERTKIAANVLSSIRRALGPGKVWGRDLNGEGGAIDTKPRLRAPKESAK